MRSEEEILERFVRAKKTLALAESCTGGRVAAALTAIPGASAYFLGSFVTYSDRMKQEILGVNPETLANAGAVSKECALEMLAGVFARTGADVALVVTGIAGPTGGSLEKPVGTVWFAWGDKTQEPHVEKVVFSGGRLAVLEASVNHILQSLRIVL